MKPHLPLPILSVILSSFLLPAPLVYADSGGAINYEDYYPYKADGPSLPSQVSGYSGYSVQDYGGAVYWGSADLILSDGALFSNNYAGWEGGAICAIGNVFCSGSVTFSNNSAGYSGGAISGGTITLSDNDSVTFSGNSAEDSGGAIEGSTITLSGNGSVEFSGNTASAASTADNAYASPSPSYAYGGAIDGGENSAITLSGNGSVTFSGNTASSSSASSSYDDDAPSYAYGGAIYGGENSTITLSGNGSVEFSGNTASAASTADNAYASPSPSYAYGGAIDGGENSAITLSDNGSVEFSGNTASSSASYAYGGAIYGDENSAITLSDNGSVTFSRNSASSSSSYDWAYGGAIYGGENSTITLSGNGSVTFSGNTASSSGGVAHGGAIAGDTITLSNNGSVTFSGNSASSSSDDDAYAYGGAISADGNLSIRNNDSVLFEKNAEVTNGTYLLRSINAGGISLSAAKGKSIEFRDSVCIAYGSTVKLNADYTDAAGKIHKQSGDIIFTGKYTEAHLNELLAAAGTGRTATEEQIRNSRTSGVWAKTNLYGGRLRVEDGAIYAGSGITAMEDSAATVQLKNATLAHGGCDLIFNSGTTLSLSGINNISGDLLLNKGSNLKLNLESKNSSSPLVSFSSADLTLNGTVNISILPGNNLVDGTYKIWLCPTKWGMQTVQCSPPLY